MTIEEILKLVKDEGINHIDLKVADVWGRWRHVTLAVSSFGEKTFVEGVGFDASNLGYAHVTASDMVLIPDPATAYVEWIGEQKVLSMICDVYDIETWKMSPLDPRSLLRYTINSISDVADGAYLAPEYEFHVFESAQYHVAPNEVYHRVDAAEGFWNSGTGGAYVIGQKKGYHRTPPADSLMAVRNAIVDELLRLGIPVKYHHHEVGSCQVEIELGFTDALSAADYTMMVKYVSRNVGQQFGYVVTFMPKPMYNEAGNGMHVHQYLTRNGLNIFQGEELLGLSRAALSYIAGILSHGKSLMAFTNPSTNSYRRLVPGFEAPTSAVFGLGNRTAAIRIPAYVKDPSKRRIEFRTIDATCNPYLAFAAMILAGVDGMRRNLDPVSLGYGPLEDEGHAQAESLSTSLTESCQALAADHAYLQTFPESLIQNWIEQKMLEDREVSLIPNAKEFDLYFDL
ncbi:type I glutamate--ammonia ligase [Coprothermobacteraceae bacterium]|nr:type I glutamate--ammonia ligase [Coprothermobacteraceae bacterium]